MEKTRSLKQIVNLKLIRKEFRDTCTPGELFVDGKFFAYTCEDVVRVPGVKVKSKTVIPAGTYKVTLTMSQRFKQVLPLVHDVPMFEGIRIHSGNTAEDSEGCILVELKKGKGQVLDSRLAMNALMSKLKDVKDIKLEVI